MTFELPYKEYVHFDSTIEKSLIGVMLLEPEKQYEMFGVLESEHFHDPLNRQLYSLILEMFNDGYKVDLITLTNMANVKIESKYFDGSPAYYITRCTLDVVSSGNWFTWAAILRECFIRKKAYELQMSAATIDFKDPLQFAKETNEAIQRALEVSGQDDWHDMSQVVMKLMAHMDKVKGKEMSGVPSGLKRLDDITGGFQPTQLIVVGARPSMGKSAFATTIALNAAKQGFKIGLISLEMPEEQLGGRIASVYLDIEFWRIYRAYFQNKDEEAIFHGKATELANLPIYMSDKTRVDSMAIRGKAMKLKNRTGLDLLIVDYLQLVRTESKNGQNREREVAKLSGEMKLLAMELDIPIILLAQLNRGSENTASKKPSESNLRESGAIEQDADMVILLHRDWKAGKQTDEHGNSTEHQADVIIAKHRNGETCEIKCHYSGATMCFSDEVSNVTTFTDNPPDNPFAGFNSKNDDLPF